MGRTYKNRHLFSSLAVGLTVLLVVPLLLSGCGDSSSAQQPSSPMGEEVPVAMTYRISEQLLPEPETAFQSEEENLVLSQTDCFSANGQLCYLYTVYRMQDDLPFFHGCCLFTLDLSRRQWDCQTVALDGWETESRYLADRIVDVNEEGAVLALQDLSGSNPFPDCLGFCDKKGNQEFWGKADISLGAPVGLYFTGEDLYAVSGNSLTVYDLQLKPGQSRNLTDRLTGCLASGSDFLWYGFDADRNLAVWDKPGGNRFFPWETW